MISALHHFEAHRAGGAFDDLGRRVDIVGVQILHLRLGDLAQRERLILPAETLPGSLEPDFRLAAFLIRIARRRRLRLEREAAIRIDGDDRRDRHALFQVARSRR